jgi:N12 class adenine-specific DNA methylase
MPSVRPTSRSRARNTARSSRPASTLDTQLALFDFGSEGELVLHPGCSSRNDVGQTCLNIGLRVSNYRITPADRIGHGGLRQKAEDNLRAIRLLASLEAEGRPASPEEQSVLVHYAGWGALPQVFEDDHPEWGDVGRELCGLLSSEDHRQAAASTPNAHYTSETVIRGIYRLLAHLGFGGGRVLEPALGIGHFIGLLPAAWTSTTRWTGIELDPITGRIARTLYPECDIRIQGFEHATLEDGSYDLVLGNVPFGTYPVFDPVYNSHGFRIHDYFFARALAAVRPGGVVAMLTSRFTLDKMNGAVREHLAERADLLGALRLPNTAFRANAGTDVTTDLLILQRRPEGATPAGETWLELAEVETPDGPARINEYFARHPEMMLGEVRLTGRMYQWDEPTLVARPEEDLGEAIAAAAHHLPAEVFSQAAAAGALDPIRIASPMEVDPSIRDGAFVLVGSELRVRDGARLVEHGLRSTKDVRRVIALVGLRDAVRRVLESQVRERSEGEQEVARGELNRLYDLFVGRWGPINREVRVEDRRGRTLIRRPNLAPFRRDPEAMNVAALEIYDAETDTARKAVIFTQRVVRPRRRITHTDRVEDALLVVLDRRGRVDLSEIGALWGGRGEEEVIEELGDQLYRDPESGAWETADAYLSGAVRDKLRRAREAAQAEPAYTPNIAALEAVQPEDLKPSEIDASLGAAWIPREDVEWFIRDLLGSVAERAAIEIAHLAREAAWRVSAPPWVLSSVEARMAWGTGRAHAIRLIEDSLNQRTTQIYDTVEEIDPETGRKKKRTVRNARESLDAQEKQRAIQERFATWVWEEPERATRLLARYNETFNGIRLREYDGRHLTLPGASDAIQLDPHQKNFVWRVLQDGNALAAHVVGAGKTFAMVAAGMELRRIGLARKVCHVVPNHMLEQYSRELLQLYPSAHILVASSEDFAGDGRRRFMARIATDDFDAIVVTHASFAKLPVSAEFEAEFIRSEVRAYREMLEDAADESGKRLRQKQLQQAIKGREVRLEQLSSRHTKDRGLSFEELGIDALFIDEAHVYKNLDCPSKIQGIPRPSKPPQRATDMLMKCLFLETIRPGRGVVFATGTPVSNSICEVYVMLRYLAPVLLERAGLSHFDAWAATFTRQVTALELSPDGSSYRMRTRFHFSNVSELVAMFRTVADVQVAEANEEDLPQAA